MKEYVNSGKARYVFVDYPIAQLHPDAFKSHEAANCAGDQGKYWQMHESLFANAPVQGRGAAHRTRQTKTIGLDVGKFSACMSSGRHAVAIRDSIERMQELGVGGTPLTLIGITPAARRADEDRRLGGDERSAESALQGDARPTAAQEPRMSQSQPLESGESLLNFSTLL